MASIRILPEHLINQIAAGEVIERPASVIKELVENSIDAQAQNITIEIVKGGIETMVVTDDGVGMDEMNARMAFERHATSKIGSMEDLFRLRSLGFRGEALSSIASVSKVVVHTKPRLALSGTRLEKEGGNPLVVTAAGCPEGTKFEISNLFFNTPARKKYLKSDQTEYRHVLEVVQDLVLAHPEVNFRFISNGRVLFDLLKTDKLLPRIGALFGKAVSEEMVEVFYGGRDIQISGYIGKPHTARTTRKYQYFIINGRAVNDTRLSYAVKEAYSNTIPASQHPLFVLSVTIDPEKIDVNVHPRKLEVRFSDPQEIFRVVKSTVHSALERSPLTPQWPLHHQDLDTPAFLRKPSIMARERPKVTIEESAGTYDGSLFAEPPVATPSFSDNRGFWGNSRTSPSPSPIESTGTDTFDARKAYLLQKRAERMALQGTPPTQETNPTSSLFQSANFKTNTPPVSSIFDPARAIEVSDDTSESPSFSYKKKINYTSEASPFVSAPAVSIPSSGLQALAQVAQSYIVAQDAEGIVIIDQHAAHERVMLGRLRNNEAAREPAKQSLLAPTHLELDYREKAILEENLDLLNSLGFEIETFGGNTFTVEAVPDFLAGEDIEAIMKGFIDDLLNDQSPMEAHRRHEHILHTIACRAAAKFGKKLSLIEQEALIRSLEGTDDSCACAHGRPTMIRLRFDELEKKFGRK